MNHFHTPPIIIDIEASGFGPESYPIEIGVVLSDGLRQAKLIHPHESWTFWSDDAEKIHGIKREQLLNRGLPVREAALALNHLLRNERTFSDCWVVDKPWLDKLFLFAKVKQSFSLSPIEAILPDEQIYYWDKAKEMVQKQLNVKRHRASTDAMVIQQTYLKSKELAKINGANSVA